MWADDRILREMNKAQKRLVFNFVFVAFITVGSVLAMVNLKDLVNRAEVIRAMEYLGKQVLQYKQDYGAVPPQSYVDELFDTLPGHARVDKLEYRARWLDIESSADVILAYSQKRFNSFLIKDGYVLLRLAGRVEWMGTEEFTAILIQQQSPMEREMIEKER